MSDTPASPPALPQRAETVRSPVGMSAEIDRIAEAVAAAQGMMFSPARNRNVEIRPKDGSPAYNYRYATLDVINDMIRFPLSEAGLSLMHFTVMTETRVLLKTRLLLKGSNQWLETTTPVLVLKDTAQSFGSAVTYAKRYAICTLLNIASEEDDDASEATGNTIVDHDYPKHPGAAERAMRERLNRLTVLGNTASTPREITEMLQVWQRDSSEFIAYRHQEGRADAWETLFRLVPQALGRVFGDDLAACWRASVLAESLEDVDRLRELWNKAKPSRGKMNIDAPVGYGLLAEHVRSGPARVERLRETREIETRLLEVAADRAAAKADAPAPAMPPWTPFDEVGEVAGEPAGSATAFAEMYVRMHLASDEPANLAEQNARMLEACAQDAAALAILADHGCAPEVEPQAPIAEPEPVAPAPAADVAVAAAPVAQAALPLAPVAAPRAVAVVKTGRGTPDLAAYLVAVKRSLMGQDTAETLMAWIAANHPTYDQLPQGTRLAVLAMVENRKLVLGCGAAA